MKKIIACVFLILVCFSAVCVYANAEFNVFYSETAMKNKPFRVHGETGLAQSDTVTLCITYQGKIMYADEIISDNNGAFDFKLYAPDCGEPTAEMKILISYSQSDKMYEYNINVIDEEYIDTLVETLAGASTANEVSNILSSNYACLGLEFEELSDYLYKAILNAEFSTYEQFTALCESVRPFSGLMNDALRADWIANSGYITETTMQNKWYESMSDIEKNQVHTKLFEIASKIPYADLTAMANLDDEFLEAATIIAFENVTVQNKDNVIDMLCDFSNILNINSSVVDAYTGTQKMSICNAYVNADIAEIKDITDVYKSAVSGFGAATPDTGIKPSYGYGGGGSSSGGSNTYYASVEAPSTESIRTERFSDMTGAEWAKTAVETMANQGIINGYTDGSFRPFNNVKREEFVKMISAAAGLEYGGTMVFSDCDENEWYAPYIAAAYGNGIVNGVSDNVFGIGTEITRQDAAVMLYRAAVHMGAQFTEENIDFADYADISDYAKKAVGSLKAAGILNGDNEGRFNPAANANRAEAAQMLYKLLASEVVE